VLEIGCGDGNFLAFLRNAGWQVEGHEVDSQTADIVRRRHGIKVATGSLDDLAVAFPVVAAYHVLEHVYHPATWLQTVKNLLEPGGLLHLQVPNGASLTRRVSGPAWSSWVFPQHVYFYDPRTLQAILVRHGFAIVAVTTWDPWHGPGSMTATAAGMVGRLRARNPRSVAGNEGPPERQRAAASPGPDIGHRPVKRFLRKTLETGSAVASRIEAAMGLGAVVDVIARREVVKDA
jgi:hypothetical protein